MTLKNSRLVLYIVIYFKVLKVQLILRFIIKWWIVFLGKNRAKFQPLDWHKTNPKPRWTKTTHRRTTWRRNNNHRFSKIRNLVLVSKTTPPTTTMPTFLRLRRSEEAAWRFQNFRRSNGRACCHRRTSSRSWRPHPARACRSLTISQSLCLLGMKMLSMIVKWRFVRDNIYFKWRFIWAVTCFIKIWRLSLENFYFSLLSSILFIQKR